MERAKRECASLISSVARLVQQMPKHSWRDLPQLSNPRHPGKCNSHAASNVTVLEMMVVREGSMEFGFRQSLGV